MPDDRKRGGGLGSLLGGSDADEDEKEPAADIEGGKRDAAMRAMKAAKADDADAFKAALTDFVGLCMQEDY